jgi:hypothetical protein
MGPLRLAERLVHRATQGRRGLALAPQGPRGLIRPRGAMLRSGTPRSDIQQLASGGYVIYRLASGGYEGGWKLGCL